MLTCALYDRYYTLRACCVVLLLSASMTALTQDAVNLLRMSRAEGLANTAGINLPASIQPFEYANHLIAFTAEVDGTPGRFLLDTGSPQLLLNNRGEAGRPSTFRGQGAAGSLLLSDRFIQSFTLSGRQFRKMWGLSLDLRAVEARLTQRIDGLVGYDLLRHGELRIDYQGKTFQLRDSRRKPRHAGRTADYTLPFHLVDHIPVITVRSGRKKLRLAIDTGASINLLDDAHSDLTLPLGETMSIQGLDGKTQDLNAASLRNRSTLPGDAARFLLMDFAPLRAEEVDNRIDGILGSSYLENFTIGIDYRRGRIYLWEVTD